MQERHFLTAVEIAKLTGFSSGKREQAMMLERKGIPYLLGSAPFPLVARTAVMEPTWLDPEPVDEVLKALCVLEEDAIVGRARPYPRETGVYFLIDRFEIVYVGMSFDILSRIPAHADKAFDRVFWITCPHQYVGSVEKHYIEKFRPKYNVQGVQKSVGKPVCIEAKPSAFSERENS